MSVQTTADENVENARLAVSGALVSVSVAVNSLCIDKEWGADEYNSDFKMRLIDIQARLYKIRAELEG